MSAGASETSTGTIEASFGATEAPKPACPFCDGRRTELASAFGSHASLSTWWCDDCRSPFEVLRWREKGTRDLGRSGLDPDAGSDPGQPSSKSTSA